MKIGIVGLPLSGKTTLFNALTGSEIDTAAFMGGKSDAHQAMVYVPDDRVEKLSEIFLPKKKTPATIEYVDLAGLSSSVQKKAGFSDQFLGQIRTVDAILITLRAFTDENIPHPLTSVDPGRDLNVIESEFILSDLAIIENRMNRLERQMRAKKQDQDVREFAVLERFKESLENEHPLRQLDIDENDELLIRGYQFLTLKPLIILLNINEDDINNSSVLEPLQHRGENSFEKVLSVSAKIEMEIQQLSEEEAELFRSDLGITESAMGKLIATSYDLLGLLSFLTVGSDEVRAWTIAENTHAPIAGGTIHSDIERGFIRAEVVAFDEFISRGSLAQCRNDGVLRLEGRDYIVKDGDIINFRFAV